MSKYLFFILFLLIIAACYSKQKTGCKKFHIGKFVTHSFESQYIVLERNDSIQTKTNNLTGHFFKERINWINDCEYQLSDFLEKRDSNDSLKPIWVGKVITTKILDTKNDYCVFESRMTDASMKMIDTLYLLKQ